MFYLKKFKMKKSVMSLFVAVMFAFSPTDSFVNQIKIASRKIQQDNWEVLFDGTGADKWRGKSIDGFPEKGWKIKDGLLFLDEKGGGDIITKEKYSDFELVFQFNLTKEANSGIKYFVGTIVNQETGNIMINGPEYQIIDDYNNIHV